MLRWLPARTTFNAAFRSAVATAQPTLYQHNHLATTPQVEGDGMKLLTHNMMKSHVKGITNGYPLIIRVSDAKTSTKDACTHATVRIQWTAIRGSAF